MEPEMIHRIKNYRYHRSQFAEGIIDMLTGGTATPRMRILFGRLWTLSFALKTPGKLEISIASACEFTGLPRATYVQTLRDLKDAGWVVAERQRADSGKDIPSMLLLIGSRGESA